MAFIQVPPDSTGKQVETFTPGTNHRQGVVIVGDTAAAEVAEVSNIAPVATEYGLFTRGVLRREGQTLTTTPLGVSGVFTQTAQDGNEDGTLFVSAVAEADQNSATDGFVIQEYDGDDDDFTDTSHIRTVASATYTASSPAYLYATIRGRKWRVRFTNGGTGQTSFKLTSASSQAPVAPQIDYDTGTGVREVPVQGIALPGSGGPVAGGTSTNPVRTDPTGTTTQPVSGTVTVTHPQLGGGTEAGAQRVTIANDSTGLLSVDDNGGSLTVDAPLGTPVHTRISDGTDVVNVTAANELNVLASAQPGVDIGDVTINNAAGASAVNVQDGGNSITVDAPVATPVNVQISDGTDTALVSAAGALVVDGSGVTQPVSGTVTANAGTGDFLTVIGHTINEAFKEAGAVGGQLDDTATTAATENNIAPVRITAQRGFHVNLRNDGGTEVGTSGAPVRTDPTGTTTQPVSGTVTVTHPQLGGGTEAGAQRVTIANDSTGLLSVDDNGASLTVDLANVENATLADNAAFTDGTTRVMMGGFIFDDVAGTALTENDAAAARVDSKRAVVSVIEDETTRGRRTTVTAANALKVDGSAVTQPVSGTVNIGTFPDNEPFNMAQVSGTAASVNAGNADAGTQRVVLASDQVTVAVDGNVANDAVDAGDPVKIGGKANLNEPTAVSADNDRVDAWFDRHGRLVVLNGHANPEPPVTVNATASGNTTVIAAPGASVSLYICKGSVHNGGAANITVILQDGAGGTNRWAAELASEGGGSLFDFGSRGWKLTANTLLNANLSAAGDVRVNITEYYIAA